MVLTTTICTIKVHTDNIFLYYIGQKFGMNELKCYLISLLRRYNVKSLYNKLEDLDLSIQGGVMKAGNGVHLAFTERNQINK